MAMTKAEKALLASKDDEIERLHTLMALRTTPMLEPDIPIPTPGASRELSVGWTFNDYSKRVEPACSSSVSHGLGQIHRTNSQRGIRLFSTRLKALQAMRAKLERRFANELRQIDLMIEQETGSPTLLPGKETA